MKKPDISELELIGKGPVDGTWRGHYLRCPTCGDMVEKKGCNTECY